jgi:hypothetical protein
LPGASGTTWAGQHFDANWRVKRLEATSASKPALRRAGARSKQLTISREALIEIFHRHRTLYDRLRLPPEVAWAQPYVAEMAELMHSVRLQ